MDKNKKPCPVCPNQVSYSEDNYRSDLKKYIDILKPEDRASATDYEKRLSCCRSCENNSNGLCTHCGCYVEIRCIVKRNHCPAPISLWC